MTNPARNKGTAFETAVVEYMRTHGFVYAERRALHGNKDKGDIAGIPGFVAEAKCCKTTTLGPWLDEAHLEARNAHATIGVVIHKRRGKGSAGDAFVTCDLATFCQLLADNGNGQEVTDGA